MITLGIETSCDETALALIETRGDKYRVIESLVHSQAELHSAYGGVFPTLAKREHSKNLVPLLKKLLEKSEIYATSKDGAGTKIPTTLTDEDFGSAMAALTNLLALKNSDLLESIKGADFLKKIPPIDRIAVTEGPGLEPALWVGINFARILSTIWKIPVMAVNHMEGHIVGSLLQTEKPYGVWQKLKELPLPAVALLISGGHTELVKIEVASETYKYTVIGRTKDDAVGEAFDKVARLLGLPYPGGPHISKLAHEAREKGLASPIKLPRPMIGSNDCDFSFSGLKTAVLYAMKKIPTKSEGGTADNTTSQQDFKAGLAREFEDAVAETLDKKLRRAIDEQNAKAIVIGGGVSANRLLRERFNKTAEEYGIPIFLPDHHISGDNALMIALVATMKSSPESDHDASKTLHANGTKKLS